MIAMALMCGPELLIADEPTTALDVTIQAQILRLLADLQKDLGIAMVLITHDLGVVARIAHRVAVMYAGEIVEEGPSRRCSKPQASYARPDGIVPAVIALGSKNDARLVEIPAWSVADQLPAGCTCAALRARGRPLPRQYPPLQTGATLRGVLARGRAAAPP
jgi:ABC-type dipeptide/oligopeptide/nickel transport system ATPase component